jgi:hypothetical protein
LSRAIQAIASRRSCRAVGGSMGSRAAPSLRLTGCCRSPR